MAQTRLGSFAEAWANIAVGFAINFTANMLILPMFGFAITASKAFGIGLIFTAISLVRSYVLRRWFNGLKFGNTPEPVGNVTISSHAIPSGLSDEESLQFASRLIRSKYGGGR
jgi:hypothetical protein